MSGNLGATALRRPRRAGDPMRAYDALPPDLRRWLAGAALPWSPASCRRLWDRARRRGLAPDEAIASLARAEWQTLAREAETRGRRPDFPNHPERIRS